MLSQAPEGWQLAEYQADRAGHTGSSTPTAAGAGTVKWERSSLQTQTFSAFWLPSCELLVLYALTTQQTTTTSQNKTFLPKKA